VHDAGAATPARDKKSDLPSGHGRPARLLFPKASPAAVAVLTLMQRPPTFVTRKEFTKNCQTAFDENFVLGLLTSFVPTSRLNYILPCPFLPTTTFF